MDTGGVENLVGKLEMTMKNADSKLELLSMKLDLFESKIILHDDEAEEEKHPEPGASQTENDVKPSAGPANEPNAEEDTQADKTTDDDGIDPKLVRELLSEVTRVRCEYDQLHNEIRQVQELQQEVTRSVRKQMKQVQSHFDDLRSRIIGSGGGGKLPTK